MNIEHQGRTSTVVWILGEVDEKDKSLVCWINLEMTRGMTLMKENPP